MARIGRPQKPFVAKDGTIVQGFYHCPDGRWLVKATGIKFTEADERLAIAKFLAMQAPPPTVAIPIEGTETTKAEIDARLQLAITDPLALISAPSAMAQVQAVGGSATSSVIADGKIVLSHKVNKAAMWAWMREQLILHPAECAKMCGIPQLASLASLPMPRPSIKLSDLTDIYRAKNPASDKAKQEAISVFNRLTKHAGATTLEDLTTDRLTAWRDEIETSVGSGGTKEAYFSRVKTIIGFGLRVAMDASQIEAALTRCKVLWTAAAKPQVDPQPISREAFHRLCKAGNGSWKPWLLCGLNLCMHLDEVCDLKWEELDLAAGTYASIRGKTASHRIPRAATLWPETIAALKAIPRRGRSPYVFTSTHDTRYNRNTRGNDFADLRTAAGLPGTTFDSLRDGAYTSACQANNVDDKWARLLAGHKAPGLQDNYVLRNPAIVKPACDAVHKAYFGKRPSSCIAL